jgi:hypothetical protein
MINEYSIKAYFCQNQGVLNFCTGVNLLLMRIQKFKTTTSLATKMLFRLGSSIFVVIIAPLKGYESAIPNLYSFYSALLLCKWSNI